MSVHTHGLVHTRGGRAKFTALCHASYLGTFGTLLLDRRSAGRERMTKKHPFWLEAGFVGWRRRALPNQPPRESIQIDPLFPNKWLMIWKPRM